jgi:hypothetical protein
MKLMGRTRKPCQNGNIYSKTIPFPSVSWDAMHATGYHEITNPVITKKPRAWKGTQTRKELE